MPRRQRGKYHALVRDGFGRVDLGWYDTPEAREEAQRAYREMMGIDNSPKAVAQRAADTKEFVYGTRSVVRRSRASL